MNNYIQLKTSAGTTYYFRVLFPKRGYHPIRRKAGKIQPTVTGKIDYQPGPVMLEWQYDLLVAATDPEGGSYGTLSGLKTLFDLNDPNGTPTNVLQLRDHYDTEWVSVYINGTLEEEPYSPKLSGAGVWFRVPIHLVKTTAES